MQLPKAGTVKKLPLLLLLDFPFVSNFKKNTENVTFSASVPYTTVCKVFSSLHNGATTSPELLLFVVWKTFHSCLNDDFLLFSSNLSNVTQGCDSITKEVYQKPIYKRQTNTNN
jgi:hypothetical protein